MKAITSVLLPAMLRIAMQAGLCVLCVSSSPAQDVRVPTIKRALLAPARYSHGVSAALRDGEPYAPFARFFPSAATPATQRPTDSPTLGANPVLLSRFRIPVYLYYTDQPHTLVGHVWIDYPPPGNNPREDAVKLMVATAREAGADALIVIPAYTRPNYYACGVAVSWR